jgi:hypothetical protein
MEGMDKNLKVLMVLSQDLSKTEFQKLEFCPPLTRMLGPTPFYVLLQQINILFIYIRIALGQEWHGGKRRRKSDQKNRREGSLIRKIRGQTADSSPGHRVHLLHLVCCKVHLVPPCLAITVTTGT